MSTDDRHSDHDLKAYLDGRDGVSAAYQKTTRDAPSAALDRLVLKTARERPGMGAELRTKARRPYALAASLMIGVLAASLYFRLPEEGLPAATRSVVEQPAVEPVEFLRDDNAEALPPDAEQEQQERPTTAASPQEFPVRQLAPPMPTVGAEPVAAPLRNEGTATDTTARAAAEPAAVVIDGALLERIEAEAAQAQAAQGVPGDLEEITITGSRIRRDEADLSYRNSRETWLDEIRTLSEELQGRSRLASAYQTTAAAAERLEQEMELFLAEYPDTNLDAELEE